MVSLRCKLIVRSELEKMHLHSTMLELGEVEILEELNLKQQQELKNSLRKFGLELMEDKKSMLIEKIKNIIVEMIHYSDVAHLSNQCGCCTTHIGGYFFLDITFSGI